MSQKNEIIVNRILAKKCLSEEEMLKFEELVSKLDDYKEKLKLKEGDSLKRKSDGKIFIYSHRATFGFGNGYVEELETHVYLADFEKVIG